MWGDHVATEFNAAARWKQGGVDPACRYSALGRGVNGPSAQQLPPGGTARLAPQQLLREHPPFPLTAHGAAVALWRETWPWAAEPCAGLKCLLFVLEECGGFFWFCFWFLFFSFFIFFSRGGEAVGYERQGRRKSGI